MNTTWLTKGSIILILPALLAGLMLISPAEAAPNAIVVAPPDYCITSGITSPVGLNGTYLFTGTLLNDRPVYTLGAVKLEYSAQGSAPVRWNLIDSLATTYYDNSSSASQPPSSGWTLRNGDGILTVSCGYGLPPTPPAPGASQPALEPTKSPVTYIYSDGIRVYLSCRKTLSTSLVLPGGNMAILYCPVSGLASNENLDQAELPADVTGGGFVAAMHVQVSGAGTQLATLPTPWVVTFKMPDGASASQLGILFWDEVDHRWVELPASGDPLAFVPVELGSGRRVLAGVHQFTRTHVSATVNFTGIFVLIRK